MPPAVLVLLTGSPPEHDRQVDDPQGSFFFAMNVFEAQWLKIMTARIPEQGGVIHIPTGNGKTTLALDIIRMRLQSHQRVVFLCPLRAVAREIFEKWTRELDVPVGIFTGEHPTPPVPYQEARVLIMTTERMEAVTRFWPEHWGWLPEVGLLIVDELHLLAEGRRGFVLEMLISRMRRLNPLLQVLGLSATLGSPERLASWLGGPLYQHQDRAVPQRWEVRRFRRHHEKLEQLKADLQVEGPTLVFVNSRRRARDLALKHGGLCHHAGLSADKRKEVEKAFLGGENPLLFATSSLEMGVNLPAKRVILFDLEQHHNGSYQPISAVSCHQRAGRAGRYGMFLEGEVVLYVHERDPGGMLERYLKGDFGRTFSAMMLNWQFKTQWVLAEIACRTARTLPQLQRAYRTLYVGHTLDEEVDLSWDIEDLLRARLITEDQGRFVVTRRGFVCMRFHLQARTMEVLDLLKKDFTVFDLIHLACFTEDVPKLYWLREKDQEETLRAESIPSWLRLNPQEDLTAFYFKHQHVHIGEVKRTARVLYHLCESSGDQACLDFYQVERPDLERIAADASRVLEAFAMALPAGWEDLQLKLTLTSKMVQHFLPRETATLTLVPGIGGKTARKLHESGIHDIEELALLDVNTASCEGISPARLQRWVEVAEGLVEQGHSAFHLKDALPKAQIPLSHLQVDLYRLYRARELTVTPLPDGTFQVTGGSEPHQATLQHCDCLDHQAGHTCKHILAVRLHHGEVFDSTCLQPDPPTP